MNTIESTIIIAIIRESVSLFVLLVLIFLSYRLIDKFGTMFLDVMERIAEAIEGLVDN